MVELFHSIYIYIMCCQVHIDLASEQDRLDQEAARARASQEAAVVGAAKNSEWSRVELMVELEPTLNQAHNAHGNTCSHFAVINQNQTHLQYLLEHKADPNAANTFGFTPLHLAALHGDVTCGQLLVDHGADVRLKAGIRDEWAARYAAAWGSEDETKVKVSS